MKTGFYTPALRVFKCAVALLFLLAFAPKAQSQYIPIDTGLAIILNNTGMAGCIVNSQMDTNCAKAYAGSAIYYNADAANPPKSYEGVQYIYKNQIGQPASFRPFQIPHAEGAVYIPDLPPVYGKVYIYGADSLFTPPYPGDSAIEYELEGVGIHTLPVLPPYLKKMYASGTSITSLPALPVTITQLSAWNNKLTSLPTLPAGLTLIEVFGNELTSLPSLPANLRYLQCQQNNITVLPALPAALQDIDCSNNLLTALPTLPLQLQTLVCNHNGITQLPVLPSTLMALLCGNNPLTALPDMPAPLTTLYCQNCQISELPALHHTNLFSLDCSHNPITTLPLLPNTNMHQGNGWDIDITANNCLLDSITNIPPRLGRLVVNNNNLTTLPPLSSVLETLSVTNNHMQSLQSLPATLWFLHVDSNPIVCLPPLPDTLLELTTVGTNITCLPNIPTEISTLLPVCGAGDACQVTTCITGRAFIDINNNCVYDNGDLAFKNKVMHLRNTGFYALTDTNGNYQFIPPAGNYEVELVHTDHIFVFACADSIIPVSYDGLNRVDSADIAIKAVTECARLEVDISAAIIRIAIPNKHTLLVKNTGVGVATNVVVKVKFDPELIPLGSIPAWSQQLPGNILVFNIGNLQPQAQWSAVITDSTSINSIFGQAACVRASVTSGGQCVAAVSPAWDSSHIEVQSMWVPGQDSIHFIVRNIGHVMAGPSQYRIYEEELLMLSVPFQLPGNDSIRIKVPANGHTFRVEADQRPGHPGLSKPRDFMELAGGPAQSLHMIIPVPQDDDDKWVEIDCQEIRNGFDPNEKQVFPAGVGSSHYVTAQDKLEYVLHFQNTGNDTAFNIRLTDTLDATTLDITSFESGVSSHPYTVSMHGEGIVTWRFANILLPDSNVNEPGSHGFVKFKINQVAGNVPGTVINNFVDIYFDYNEPVRTNTAFVTIEEKEKIFLSVVEPNHMAQGYTIQVMPNPFAETTNFVIATENTNQYQYTFELFDMLGRRVVSKQVGNRFSLNRGDIDAGVYMYRLTTNSTPVGTGKIVAR